MEDDGLHRKDIPASAAGMLERLPVQSPLLHLHITAHSFFNILNSIYHSIDLAPRQAEEILMQFSELMQYYVYDCSREKVILEKEIQAIQNFIALQKMNTQFQWRGNFHLGEFMETKMIPTSLLFSLVEAALNHGVKNLPAPSYLELDLSVINDICNLKLSFPVSSDSDDTFSFNSKVIQMMHRRLESLYPSSHSFTIEQKASQCSLILSIFSF